MDNLSAANRGNVIDKLKATTFDLLIIGGGITGAGIALDASARGLRTALIEKNDFASGTSSRSTKLVHGGLRYLKQLEFGLVAEVGSERAIVHHLAPHLVVPEKMLLPLYENRGFGSVLTSIGLKMYDWLAGVKGDDQRKMLTRSQALSHEPLLQKDQVKGGAIYAEYRTDDARLTIEVIKAAARKGAQVLSYAKVADFIYNNDAITGVRVEDQWKAGCFEVMATTIVNAAGPWVDELRVINKSKTGKSIHLTKGVHFVTAHGKLPVRQAIYFDVGDGRMIFAIPRGRITYVGTTDTNYTDDKDEVHANREDIEYLINAVNNEFRSAKLTIDDIESSWAGLRPLIHEDGKSPSELSRRDEIFESPTGLISIAGGKLTGYRKMAERVVDLVVEKNFTSYELKPCETEQLALMEDGFHDYQQVTVFQTQLTQRLKPLGFSKFEAEYLVDNYGKQVDAILNDLQPGDTDIQLALAELRFCIQHELVLKPIDFLLRRTGLLNFNIQRAIRVKDAVLKEFQKTFSWSAETMSLETETINRDIAAPKSFLK